MKRTLIIIILALVITGLASFFFFSKTEIELLTMLPFIQKSHAQGSLSITSPIGISTVEIDDVLSGETPLTSEKLSTGTHKVKLTRKTTQEETFYKEHVFYVSIEPNTEAIINLEIGPNDNIYGYILYYEDISTESGKGSLSVNGSPLGMQVKIDGESMGTAPYFSDALWEGEYKLKFVNEKYESLEFPVNIEEGFNLNISAYLMSIPINIQQKANEKE